MTPNRRDFIKFVVAGSVAGSCPIDLSLLAAETSDPKSSVVEGEDNRICHQVRDGKIFSRHPVSEKHDVVIIGGGVSGLTAAYRLRDLDFLLLEKEPHWGGNAYLGSAFLGRSEIAYDFAREIGLEPLPINDSDSTILKGEWIPDTWRSGLDKLPYPVAVREGFKKFRKDLLSIDFEKREKELSGVPFSDLIKGYPDEIKQWWDNYGPSNWGATSDETTAALAVEDFQELAGENGNDYYTWPGGLGAITKRLSEILLQKS